MSGEIALSWPALLHLLCGAEPPRSNPKGYVLWGGFREKPRRLKLTPVLCMVQIIEFVINISKPVVVMTPGGAVSAPQGVLEHLSFCRWGLWYGDSGYLHTTNYIPPPGASGSAGPIRYGRIISLSSCSTMWQCQTNWKI